MCLYSCLSYRAYNSHLFRVVFFVIYGLSISNNFFTFSHKRHYFWEKIIAHKLPLFISHTNFARNVLILRRIQLDIITTLQRHSCKIPVILVRILLYLSFLYIFFFKSLYIKFDFMKIRPLAAEIYHADGQTDRRTGTGVTKIIRNFANVFLTILAFFLCSINRLTREIEIIDYCLRYELQFCIVYY